MAQNPLAGVLSTPSQVPLYLGRFAIAVDYLTMQPDDDREALEDAVSDFEAALQLGFFAWGHFPQRQSARLTIEWLEQGFVLHCAAGGVHHNGLVALLRMIVNLHHTPEEARDSIAAALGKDADALPPPMVFSQTVKAIRVEGLEGVNGRVSARTSFDRFIADDEIGRVDVVTFADPATTRDGDRVALATKSQIASDHFDSVEDSFLRLFDTGCFVGLDTIDDMAGDPEFFLCSGGDETQLVVEDYDGEIYGLIELLNVLSNGRLSIFTSAESRME